MKASLERDHMNCKHYQMSMHDNVCLLTYKDRLISQKVHTSFETPHRIKLLHNGLHNGHLGKIVVKKSA